MFVNLKNKSYFPHKNGLTQEWQGIAIQDKQAMAKTTGMFTKQRGGMLFYRGKWEVWGRERAVTNKKFLVVNGELRYNGSHWLDCDCLSLAGLLPGEEENIFSACGDSKAVLARKVCLSLLGLQLTLSSRT